MGWTDKNTGSKPKPKPSKITASVATNEIDELPDEIFTQEINLKNSKLQCLILQFRSQTKLSFIF